MVKMKIKLCISLLLFCYLAYGKNLHQMLKDDPQLKGSTYSLLQPLLCRSHGDLAVLEELIKLKYPDANMVYDEENKELLIATSMAQASISIDSDHVFEVEAYGPNQHRYRIKNDPSDRKCHTLEYISYTEDFELDFLYHWRQSPDQVKGDWVKEEMNPAINPRNLCQSSKVQNPFPWLFKRDINKILVGVLDTGVDYNHKKLKGKFNADFIGRDYLDGDDLPYSSLEEHGTSVAGLIARKNRYASLIALRGGHSTSHSDYQGIADAYRAGARIINISMGTNPSFGGKESFAGVAKAAEEFPDLLIIVSAGNGDESGNGMDTDKRPHYPSSYPQKNILSVASLSRSKELSYFSNYGENSIDVVAPGENIKVLKPHNKHTKEQGTSFSAPIVTRLASKMLAINPKLRPEDVIKIIIETSTPTEALKGKIKAGGYINERKAINAAKKFVPESTAP